MICYQPGLAHGHCPAGHPTHLDIDHYDTPRWVHCTIADLATCPAEMSDLAGDYVGKHRVTPTLLSGCTCGGIGDTGSHYAGCAWAVA